MSFGIPELLLILVIVLLLFGTTKLKSLGSDLGSAIKGFRTAIDNDDNAKLEADVQESVEPAESTAEKAEKIEPGKE